MLGTFVIDKACAWGGCSLSMLEASTLHSFVGAFVVLEMLEECGDFEDRYGAQDLPPVAASRCFTLRVMALSGLAFIRAELFVKILVNDEALGEMFLVVLLAGDEALVSGFDYWWIRRSSYERIAIADSLDGGMNGHVARSPWPHEIQHLRNVASTAFHCVSSLHLSC